jgi:biopolymer transport protein ExbD
MAGGGRKPGKRPRIHKVKKQPLPEVRNEINVTPLVDVCLVLLIIFMVVTPMLARGKEVPLPKTYNHLDENDSQQPIVAIDGDGQLYFDKYPVADIETLKQRVEEAWRAEDAASAQGRVFVKADREIEYGKVYPIIIAMHEIGVAGVDLGTNENKDGGGQ